MSYRTYRIGDALLGIAAFITVTIGFAFAIGILSGVLSRFFMLGFNLGFGL